MGHNLNITHNSDSIFVEDAITINKDLLEGFSFSIPEIYLKTPEFVNFISEVMAVLGTAKKYDYSTNVNNIQYRYVSGEYKLYVRGSSKDVAIAVVSKTEEINHQIFKIYTKHDQHVEEMEIFLHTFYMNQNQLDDHTKNIEYEDLKYLSESYYPYLDTNLMFQQFFTGMENILMVVGSPGVGKTKLSSLALKYAYENPDKLPYDKIEENPELGTQFISVVYVKSPQILAMDKFWRSIEIQTPDFVIIDDLDYMLTKRDAEIQSAEDSIKNQFLNQFLSFTDGVEKHRTKFIITTNQPYREIDVALLRKGRLFDILELRELTHSEGLDIWLENQLDPGEFENLFPGNSILSGDIGSEISKRCNTRMSESLKKYIREDGISKINETKTKKKLGL